MNIFLALYLLGLACSIVAAAYVHISSYNNGEDFTVADAIWTAAAIVVPLVNLAYPMAVIVVNMFLRHDSWWNTFSDKVFIKGKDLS